MRLRRHSTVFTAIARAGLLWSSAAAAAERVPFHLDYAAPESCANEETWLRELGRRSSRVVLATDGQAAPWLRVSLKEVDAGVQAELMVIDLDGHATKRMLAASSCAEALQGSAWVSALWLDPSASEPPVVEGADFAAQASPPGEGESAAAVQPAENIISDPPARSTAPSGPRPVRVGASMQVGAFFTGLPGSPLGFAGFLELSAWRKSVAAPLLRLGYVSAGGGFESTERGDAHLGLTTFRAVGCVLEWPRDAWVSLRPCAVWELGQLSASGQQTKAGSNVSATWHSLGALGRAAFEIFPLISVDAEAGLIFPLARDRFVFGPDPVITGYATPALGATVSLGFTIGATLGDSAPGP